MTDALIEVISSHSWPSAFVRVQYGDRVSVLRFTLNKRGLLSYRGCYGSRVPTWTHRQAELKAEEALRRMAVVLEPQQPQMSLF